MLRNAKIDEPLPLYAPLDRPRPRTFNATSAPSVRSWKTTAYSFFLSRRSSRLVRFLKLALVGAVLLLIFGLFTWEIHIELAFYKRAWVREEIKHVEALSGCFATEKVSSAYNVTDRVYGQRRTEVQAGLPLRHDLDCYNFAGTVQPLGVPVDQSTYHSYWRTDLAPFGPRQEWFLKSFFATQDVDRGARLILWSNGDLSVNPVISNWLKKYPRSFEVRIVNIPTLAKGTALDGSSLLKMTDTRAWVDGDLIRLLVLWAYGGVWVDMDSLLIRDLSPLLEHEFITQWDCYDKLYNPFNGALMRFYKHSPYLCEAFHIMATSKPPRQGSTDWGALLYFKLWRRLVSGGVPPFKVLPWCLGDGRSCRLDNRLPDPFLPDSSGGSQGWWSFGEGQGLDQALKKVFVLHLHNQWEKKFPKDGWVDRLLLKRYEQTLGH